MDAWYLLGRPLLIENILLIVDCLPVVLGKRKMVRYKMKKEHCKKGQVHYKMEQVLYKKEQGHCKMEQEHYKMGLVRYKMEQVLHKKEQGHYKMGLAHYKMEQVHYKMVMGRYMRVMELHIRSQEDCILKSQHQTSYQVHRQN